MLAHTPDNALIVIAALIREARTVLATNPDNAAGQTSLRLGEGLRFVIRVQMFNFEDPKTWTDLHSLEWMRSKYFTAYAGIGRILAGGLAAPWNDWPGLAWVNRFCQRRHTPFRAAMHARIIQLWLLRLKLPTRFDEALYRALVFPAAMNHANDAARATGRNLLAISGYGRTATQRSLLRVAGAVIRIAHIHAVSPAVVEAGHLVWLLDTARNEDGVMEDEIGKVEAGVWYDYLDLRLAVEFCRGEKDRFEEKVNARIQELKARQEW